MVSFCPKDASKPGEKAPFSPVFLLLQSGKSSESTAFSSLQKAYYKPPLPVFHLDQTAFSSL